MGSAKMKAMPVSRGFLSDQTALGTADLRTAGGNHSATWLLR